MCEALFQIYYCLKYIIVSNTSFQIYIALNTYFSELYMLFGYFQWFDKAFVSWIIK